MYKLTPNIIQYSANIKIKNIVERNVINLLNIISLYYNVIN